uniref:Uncharacterized protein n=1 Tax=Cacopsylla melanoneura TaxID=428564 RepID=A0A8D8UUM4_9HEMI
MEKFMTCRTGPRSNGNFRISPSNLTRNLSFRFQTYAYQSILLRKDFNCVMRITNYRPFVKANILLHMPGLESRPPDYESVVLPRKHFTQNTRGAECVESKTENNTSS